jgi:uncharacterized repeat protein (TIGR03803 family)
VQGSDGNFYGTTQSGGTYNYGTVFNISTNGALTNLYSFSTSSQGSPGGLVQGSDGNFYGTTEYGGNTNLGLGAGIGTVFTVTTNGTLTNLHSFTGTNDGAYPVAPLVQGSDGNYYGTTQNGGTNNVGTIFRLTIQPQLTMTFSGADFIVSWPTNYAGYILQRTVNVGSSNWFTYTLPFPPIISNGQFVFTIPAANLQPGFFRMRSP